MKKTTEQQPKAPPNDNPQARWSPPRGIRYELRIDRPGAPYFLHWREAGTRRAASFSSDTAREKAARALAEKRAEHGHDVLTFDPKEWRVWVAFKKTVGNVDPLRVAHEWLAANKRASEFATLTIRELTPRYLEARRCDGITYATLSHAKKDMERFAEKFGDRTLNLSTNEVREWLSALPFGEVTKRNHYKRVRAFYSWARIEGLTTINPCDAIQSPAREIDDVTLLSVDDTKRLFDTARDRLPHVCAKLALEAFAGLRFSSAGRLARNDVSFADKGITLPASKIKTRKRYYIDGLPKNLWKWLKSAPDEAWSLTERQYLSLKSEAFKLAGVANPGNVLRHSFCSYHIALNKNAARTAVILCHANPRMIYQHYRGRATQRAAKEYFQIT
jgi:site-specific recombinase XerC